MAQPERAEQRSHACQPLMSACSYRDIPTGGDHRSSHAPPDADEIAVRPDLRALHRRFLTFYKINLFDALASPLRNLIETIEIVQYRRCTGGANQWLAHLQACATHVSPRAVAAASTPQNLPSPANKDASCA
ncbi:hypothetical protein WMF45_17980 [Sorangium sp. So ce448]|uniref:hypothetical protein n=1 Tax=Sorangium sp. So ce448 TaxID=3133314 RepID=UPI003F621961